MCSLCDAERNATSVQYSPVYERRRLFQIINILEHLGEKVQKFLFVELRMETLLHSPSLVPVTMFTPLGTTICSPSFQHWDNEPKCRQNSCQACNCPASESQVWILGSPRFDFVHLLIESLFSALEKFLESVLGIRSRCWVECCCCIVRM